MSIFMTTRHLATGKRAEELAGRYLTERSFRILATNWARPWGELDIIARKDDVLHFVEVKGESRFRDGFDAWRRADAAKLTKVVRTARTWMARHRYGTGTPWQIDVIQVSIKESANEAHITHFKNVLP